jgi:tripartite-type tricarboxylate transporter receptor subunit TctC
MTMASMIVHAPLPLRPVVLSRIAAWFALACCASTVAAQSDAAAGFPSRPIRIVVGFTAGGGNDLIVRIIGPRIGERLGQSVVVDNRPGAQSIIACELVAKAAPDGYTLLMGPSGPVTMNPAIYSKLPYAPTRDFAPIGIIGSFPLILVVNASSPVKSVRELIEFARARPDQANYGSSAALFQLSTELFNQKSGARFAHIPFKGSGESVNAVIGGQVTMTLADPPPAAGPLKAGRIRGLAVTSAARHASWPELPTLAEAGVPDVEVVAWTGLLAPAGTPMTVVRKLQNELQRVLQLADVRERLNALGVDQVGNRSEEFGRIIAADIAKWTAVAKANNIRAD